MLHDESLRPVEVGLEEDDDVVSSPLLSGLVETVPLDLVLESIGYGKFQRRLLFICGLTQLADAMELLIISFLTTSVACSWDLNSGQKKMITQTVFIGMLLGSISIGILSDRLGRRVGYATTVGFVGLCGLASATSQSLWSLALWRGLVGIGLGGAPAALALYAEFLPRRHRGQNLLLFFLWFSVGGVCMALVSWATLSAGPTFVGESWRLMLVCAAIPSVVLLIISLPGTCNYKSWQFSPVPPSPRFLLTTGRDKEATELLRYVAIVNGTESALHMCLGINLQKKISINMENANANRSASILTLLPSRCCGGKNSNDIRNMEVDLGDVSINGIAEKNTMNDAEYLENSVDANDYLNLRRSTFILATLFLFMAIIYYVLILLTVDFVKEFNEPKDTNKCRSMSNMEYLQVLYTNAGELPGLFFAIYLIDRIGRRGTVSLMFFLTAVSILGISITTQISGVAKYIPSLFITTLLFLARAFALGFNQSLWVLSTEIFPTTLRASGLGLVTAFARIGGFLSTDIAILYAKHPVFALVLCVCLCIFSGFITWLLPVVKSRGLRDTC